MMQSLTPPPRMHALNEDIQIRTQQALEYLQLNGYESKQVNGQRHSEKAQLCQPNHLNHTEIFIGKLPRCASEKDLLPWLLQVGRVSVIRFMIDFSGTCRGYAFAKYVDKQEAMAACRQLDKTVIIPGTEPIGINLSFDNKRLYIGNIPDTYRTEKKLFDGLNNVVTGIVKIEIPDGSANHAYVEFETHEHATRARRQLIPTKFKIGGRDVTVDWAKCKPPVSPNSAPNNHRFEAPNGTSPIININNNNNPSIIDYNNRCISKPVLSPIPASPAVSPPSFQRYPPSPIFSKVDQFLWAGDILGERTKAMLDLTFDSDRTVVVSNLNLNEVKIHQLKRIFELEKLNITEIEQIDSSTIYMIYKTAEQSDIILGTLNIAPQCFQKITKNGLTISARKGLSIAN